MTGVMVHIKLIETFVRLQSSESIQIIRNWLDSSARAPGCWPLQSAKWWWSQSSEQKRRRGSYEGWSFDSSNSWKNRKLKLCHNAFMLCTDWEASVYGSRAYNRSWLTWNGKKLLGRWGGKSETAHVLWGQGRKGSLQSEKKQQMEIRLSGCNLIIFLQMATWLSINIHLSICTERLLKMFHLSFNIYNFKLMGFFMNQLQEIIVQCNYNIVSPCVQKKKKRGWGGNWAKAEQIPACIWSPSRHAVVFRACRAPHNHITWPSKPYFSYCWLSNI